MPQPDPVLFALDAAAAALDAAEEHLRVARARVAGIGAGIDWVSPAADAFRASAGDWTAALDAAVHLVGVLADEVRAVRARLLVGGGR